MEIIRSKSNEAFPITLHPLLHPGSNSIPQNKSDHHHSSQDTVEREILYCLFSQRLYRTEPRPLQKVSTGTSYTFENKHVKKEKKILLTIVLLPLICECLGSSFISSLFCEILNLAHRYRALIDGECNLKQKSSSYLLVCNLVHWNSSIMSESLGQS